MQAFASAVASGSLPQLRELYLYGNQIGDGGMQAFASAVASGSLPQLRTLWLSNNQIGDGGMQAFASAVASGSLAHLEVCSLATALLPCPQPWHAAFSWLRSFV